MDKRLYNSGIIAIPLKRKTEDLGIMHPNFLVFDSQDSKSNTLAVNIVNGLEEEQDCVRTQFRLVLREILPQLATKPVELIERIVLPSEVLFMPVQMLPVIFTHQSIKENLAIVNLALSRFSFRGVLTNLLLEVDEDVLDEIIAQESIEANAQ